MPTQPSPALTPQARQDRFFARLVAVVSVLIPAVVAVLLFLPKGNIQADLSFVPGMNAAINATVSLLLVVGVVLIKQGKRRAHQLAMLSAFALSALFLISYVVYHYQMEETRYGGEGAIRYLYFFILITHIVLATAIVPLIFFTLYRAFRQDFARHKRLARWTFPLWLYVSVTGVLVYLMIEPYYVH